MESANPVPAKHRHPVESWVLVAGGFHRNGGMDRLNLALAAHLVDCGGQVYLVCHDVDAALKEKAVAVKIVPRPGRSFMLGELLLAREGRRMASLVRAGCPGARVVVNGGNCNWPDINWVHCVHHAWTRRDDSSPAWFKLKSRCARQVACMLEREALRAAKLLIANSERTRHDLVDLLNITPDRIHVVYPGAASAFTAATPCQRAAARAWLGKAEQRPLIAFVGAMGHDSNKGFDVLFSVWRELCARPDWDADLIAAGGGRALGFWRQRVADAGLESRITVLGFTDRVPDVLAAADLLVSPVRYEAYGLNVQEAICCGVPAMVTESAGVAERYPAQLRDLLIPDPGDVKALAAKLLQWRTAMSYWKEKIVPFSQALGRQTLDIMAEKIVALANGRSTSAMQARA
jgi:glycosyltransferase involved in cell wall biosynthesis